MQEGRPSRMARFRNRSVGVPQWAPPDDLPGNDENPALVGVQVAIAAEFSHSRYLAVALAGRADPT
jgi:hypothetical protein